ncbi:MAG: hypothetical protein ACKPBV_16925 [Sphaerospermopsis kisseleviana]
MIEQKVKYREYMELAIERAKELRNVAPTHNLNEKVKKVAVILCGSRNGSSLLKTIVSKSQDVAYLSGEEEPFYILTGNGFPYSSLSDEFHIVQNKQELLDNIFDEMGVNTKDININQIIHNWKNRIPLQDPLINPTLIYKDIERIWRSYESSSLTEFEYTYEELNQMFLETFYHGRQEFGYYDIIPENTPYLINGVNRPKIEEPPYVIPAQRRPLIESDFEDKVFIFKTPQDCYRKGVFEQLFPNAEIKYIHLSRGFAQAVNGLMDGWLSETGFFAHNMDLINDKLNIKGYSDVVKGGDKWWKFDLPANWSLYKNEPLEEVCLNQWHQAHETIINHNYDALRIKFEDFALSPQETLDKITDYLGIKKVITRKLPLIMVTETPSDYRWHKRKNLIEKLAKQPKVIQLMEKLGYSMDPKTWI